MDEILINDNSKRLLEINLSLNNSPVKEIIKILSDMLKKAETELQRDMLFNYLHKARGFVWDIIQRNGSEIPILEILKMVNRNFKRLQAAANKENVLPLVLLFSPQNTVSTHEVAKSPSSEVHTRPGILREISQNISLISK